MNLIFRHRPKAVIAVAALLAVAAAGCGSESTGPRRDPTSAAGLPAPGSTSGSSSTDLSALAECFDVNASDSKVSFIQGDDSEIAHGENFGAHAPDEIVREAVAAGGWLHAVDDGSNRIGSLDVFEFASEDAAAAAVPAIEDSRHPLDGWRYGDSYQAVQDGTVVFVLDRPYRENPDEPRPKGLDVLLGLCLPRTSGIEFTSPAGSMSYEIEVPR